VLFRQGSRRKTSAAMVFSYAKGSAVDFRRCASAQCCARRVRRAQQRNHQCEAVRGNVRKYIFPLQATKMVMAL